MKAQSFSLPLADKATLQAIIPFFLPFAGCPQRCLYCDQNAQTGESHSFAERLAELDATLATSAPKGRQRELAFYGGTFTSLPKSMLAPCLEKARRALDLGQISAVRCSTRPDAVPQTILHELCTAGFTLVELGIQSFDTNALALSLRGYNEHVAEKACKAVQDAGLKLGIQLLPGMPGLEPARFLEDVDKALALKPSCLRMYPCLVLAGAPLATLWKNGDFTPWSLETTITTLGQALQRAWAANVPVIRMALAPEQSLEKAILAGPQHPALGSLIQAEALYATVCQHLRQAKCDINTRQEQGFTLHLPKSCQGFFYGHRGSLKERWQTLGLRHVVWADVPPATDPSVLPDKASHTGFICKVE